MKNFIFGIMAMFGGLTVALIMIGAQQVKKWGGGFDEQC